MAAATASLQEVDRMASRLASLPPFPLRLLARARGERGSVLVETALTSIILLTVVFGIMRISLGVYSYFFVSNAAREATRYAIVRGATLGSDCTAPGYATCIAQGGSNTGDIKTYVTGLGFPGINPANVTVNTTWLTATGGACGTADSCKISGNQVRVTVTYDYPLSIPFVSSRTLSMTSTSQMVISQ